jgi:hypothetical protein
MTETVTSKFRNSLWIAASLFAILIFGLIVVILNLITTPGSFKAGKMQFILPMLMVFGCFYGYRVVKRLIKVTVTPDSLLLSFLLTGSKRTVNYADIVHVSRLRETSLRQDTFNIPPTTLIDPLKLKIELNTGENISLYKEYYENFDEMAEAIRRARFKLE